MDPPGLAHAIEPIYIYTDLLQTLDSRLLALFFFFSSFSSAPFLLEDAEMADETERKRVADANTDPDDDDRHHRHHHHHHRRRRRRGRPSLNDHDLPQRLGKEERQ